MALAEQGLDCMVMQAFSLGGLAAILAHLAAYIVPMKDELLPGCVHLDQTCVLLHEMNEGTLSENVGSRSTSM